MGTGGKTKRGQSGTPRPDDTVGDGEVDEGLPSGPQVGEGEGPPPGPKVWEWEGPLEDVEQFDFADRLGELPESARLGPLRGDGSVLTAYENEIVGRLPEKPAGVVADALVDGRHVRIKATEIDVAKTSVTVHVWVVL